MSNPQPPQGPTDPPAPPNQAPPGYGPGDAQPPYPPAGYRQPQYPQQPYPQQPYPQQPYAQQQYGQQQYGQPPSGYQQPRPQYPHGGGQYPPAGYPTAPQGGGRGKLIAIIIAVILLLGAAGGGTLWAVNRDDNTEATDPSTSTTTTPTPTPEPTSTPTPPTPSAPTTPPTSTASEPTNEPTARSGLVAKADFDDDWNFRLGDVAYKAKYVDGWDYPTCKEADPKGSLAKWGCKRAVEVTYTAFKGDMKLTCLFLEFDNDGRAEAAAKKFNASDIFQVQTKSALSNFKFGKWVARASRNYVVVSVGTARASVRAKKAEDILHYFGADLRSSLLFR